MAHFSGETGWREIAFYVVLGTLLVVLAVLQYQWIGQVARAERDRRKVDLEAAAERFAQDFDGEIEFLARTLMGVGASAMMNAPSDYPARLQLWRSTSRHAKLVSSVVLVDRSGAQDLDQPDGPQPLPASLRHLFERATAVAAERPGPPFTAILDGEVPALALPRVQHAAGGPAVVGWILVELDGPYLRDTFFPELYLRDVGREYRLQVTDGQRSLYQSDPGVPVTTPEATTGLLNIRFGLGPAGGMIGAGFPGGGMGRGWRMGGRMGGGMGRGMFAMGSPNPPDNAVVSSPVWKLLVSQRAGPLAQLVGSTQRRNLAIGFAILLVLGAGGIMLAVSARKARLLASLQMEFVAGVTHELRTPLAVISSAGQNLADGVAAGDEKVRSYGALIREHSRRLAETVDQVLRFGGLSSGRAALAQEPTSVETLLDQAIEDSSHDLTAAGAALTREVAPGLPPIAANREAMGQCLRNLLINAARHGAGSPISVRASRDARHIEIEVENGGPGIDPHDLRRIFEPFRRGRRAVDDQIPGAGLGLALVKRIVEAHRGSVKVSSEPGRTRFRLRLPIAEHG
jgi:signal transduction histidine kinase